MTILFEFSVVSVFVLNDYFYKNRISLTPNELLFNKIAFSNMTTQNMDNKSLLFGDDNLLFFLFKVKYTNIQWLGKFPWNFPCQNHRGLINLKPQYKKI